MHTTYCECAAFIHNGDYSGDVTIFRPSGLAQEEPVQVTIPMASLLEFVAGVLRERRIAALENASVEKLLGLPRSPKD